MQTDITAVHLVGPPQVSEGGALQSALGSSLSALGLQRAGLRTANEGGVERHQKSVLGRNS
jgi:hypothetical protein